MTKSNVYIWLLMSLLASLLFSCNVRTINGDGNVASREVQITDYEILQVQGSNIELVYVQSGDAPYLKVECDQNILDVMRMEVSNNELIIRPKDKSISILPTRFIITTNSAGLKKLRMAGQGNCNLGDVITGSSLELDLAGSGAITVDSLIVDNLKCEIAGSGNIVLRGRAENTDIKAAGSCKVSAFGLQTEKVKCKMAGSNDVEITVNQEISAKIAGSGSLLYKGDPSVIDDKSVGSVRISKVD